MAKTYPVPYVTNNPLHSWIRYTAPVAGTLEIFISYRLNGHENNHDDHGLLVQGFSTTVKELNEKTGLQSTEKSSCHFAHAVAGDYAMPLPSGFEIPAFSMAAPCR
jgi:hypothetical protein